MNIGKSCYYVTAGGVLVFYWRMKTCPARSGAQPWPLFSTVAHICGPAVRAAGLWLADGMFWPGSIPSALF
jgi:hypothetical protein